MIDVYFELNRILQKEESGVLARIVRQKGSSPRGTGTRCLILQDGSLIGTIGGGRMEHLVMEEAKTVMQAQRSVLLKLTLYGKDVAETEMLCGGAVDIYLEPVSGKNRKTRRLFSALDAMLKEGKQGVMITRLADGIRAADNEGRLLLSEEGCPFGAIEGLEAAEAMKYLKVGAPEIVDSEAGTLFIEPLSPPQVLYLFGAGHISTFVCPLAARVGFRVVVIDDREAFANPDRFPEAAEVRVDAFSAAFETLAVSSSAYIVIVTRGHMHDLTVLRDALATPAKYIGMIGSRRKRDTIYKALMKEGIREEALSKVHCPIGLSISAQTPEEIAVSIVAELIAVKNAEKKKIGQK